MEDNQNLENSVREVGEVEAHSNSNADESTDDVVADAKVIMNTVSSEPGPVANNINQNDIELNINSSTPEIHGKVANQDQETTQATQQLPKSKSLMIGDGDSGDHRRRKAGYAAIKSQYLLHDYKPKLHSEYLSEQVKKTFSNTPSGNKDEASLGKHPRSQDKDDDNIDNEGQEEEGEGDEPTNKKAKLKGRNKQRPKYERPKQEDKLCPAIKNEKICSFGDNCKFTHDKQKFIERKLPDLNQLCPIFERFGYCRSGISCRYAKSHLSEQLENTVNEEFYNKMKDSLSVRNILPEDVKRKLWKRKFNFSKAMNAVKIAQKMADPSNCKNVKVCGVNSDSIINEPLQSLEVSKECLDKVDASAVQEITKDASISVSDNVSKYESLDTVNKGGSNVMVENGVTVEKTESVRTLGDITDEEVIRLRPPEKKKIDFRNKSYLAPLTTVGNLPFRRVCKDLGVDITCGEMALASQLLKAKPSEWSLIKRHPCEDLFGVQICGAWPDMMAKCAQVLTETVDLDFIDINCGCPIDLIFKKGAGSALMGKMSKLEQISRSMIGVMGDMPLTVKIRTGVYDHKQVAHNLIPRLRDAGVSLVTLHGRSREQRYTRLADWEYISKCAQAGDPMPVFGNGDVLSYEDTNLHLQSGGISGVMIARGALVKPWVFTEIKEQRHWDISANERFDILKSFSNYGLEHWGSDRQGLETTRRFMLEWLSFLHRYIPVGVLEQVPQRINERPPYYMGRNDLETLMASANCADWIKISEMLLGPVPPDFKFLPKHKANAYQ